MSGRIMTSLIVLLSLAGPLFAQVPPPPPPPPPPMPPQGAPARDVIVEATGTAALMGVVVADDGTRRPLRRAVVTARGRDLPTGRMIMTDAEGRFALTDLPGGTYSLTASKPGWVAGSFGATQSWTGPGTPVVLGDGERRTDLEIALTPGAVVTGRVYDQFGQPQAGARVLALVRRRSGGQDRYTPGNIGASLSQQTDDRGEFRVYGLPPGDYIVGAGVVAGIRSTTTMTTPEEVRWAEQTQQAGVLGAGAAPPPGPTVGYAPVYYPGTVDVTDATIITLTKGEERTGLDFQLRFVPTASVRGTVSLPDGSPARGVTLLATSASRSTVSPVMLLGSSVNRASIGPDGSFAFESLVPGEYFMTARGAPAPPGPRGRGAGPAAPPSENLWVATTVAVDGTDIDGLDLRMQPGMTLSGRVAFDGTSLEPPESLTRVSLRLDPADTTGMSVGVEPTQAGDDGTFSFQGVPPGRYVLTAGVPRVGLPPDAGWLPWRALVDGANALEEGLEVSPGRDLGNIVVEFTDRAPKLSGRVTDGNGDPVQGLTMVLFHADPAAWATPAANRFRRTAPLDADGRYELALLTPGDYLLAALADVSQADLTDPAYLEQLAAAAIPITLAVGDAKVQDVRLGGG